MASSLIDPRTNKPFRFTEVEPSSNIQSIRHEIIDKLRKRIVASRYDVAQTTHKNENHWMWADELSPNSANSLPVRKKLRSRSRYESANNGYLKGIILTKTSDTIGSGPSLQITDSRFTEQQKGAIETAYARRAKKIKLRRKLKELMYARIDAGEGFAFRTVDKSLRDKVKVNQVVFECDQVSHYNFTLKVNADSRIVEVDGIRFNRRTGEPERYHLLNTHPGEHYVVSMRPLDGRWINAEDVIHWFRRDRPWNRGIPETISTLPLWALLRRYTLAVVQNAEIAADFTVLLRSLQSPATIPFATTGTPGQPSPSNPDDWFDSFPIDRGLMTVLPEMYEATQLDPKQPVSAYDIFVNALVQEAARPLLVPRNMALGNSGEYNMASGALDRQMYAACIKDERLSCEEEVLDKDLDQWWYEAVRTPGYFDDGNQEGTTGVSMRSLLGKYPNLREEPPDHVYRWDEIPEHHDPVKIAQAVDILFRGNHLSDTDIQEGRFNRRVEDHYTNLEMQQKRRKEIGLIEEPSAGNQPTNGNKPKPGSRPKPSTNGSRRIPGRT